MTDPRPPALLDRLWDQLQVGPPTVDLIRLAGTEQRRRRGAAAVAVTLLVAAVIASGALLSHSIAGRADPAQMPEISPPPQVTSKVVLSPRNGIPVYSFTPAPPGTKAPLTSQQVFTIAVGGEGAKDPDRKIPATTTVTLGYLNAPLPKTWSAHRKAHSTHYDHLLVWAFRAWGCPGSQLPSAPVDHRPCVFWDFFGATTGRQIVGMGKYESSGPK